VITVTLAIAALQGLEKADQLASIGAFTVAIMVALVHLLKSIDSLWAARRAQPSSRPKRRATQGRPRGDRWRPRAGLSGARAGLSGAPVRQESSWLPVVALMIVLLPANTLAASPPAGPSCKHPVQLNVLTSAEKGPAVRIIAALFEDWSRGPSGEGCQRVDALVSTVPSADVAIKALSGDWPPEDMWRIGPIPHVWLPDSSVDLAQVRAAAGDTGRLKLELKGSVAESPVVLAMPNELGDQMGWPEQRFWWRDLVARLADQTDPNRRADIVVKRTNPRSSSTGLVTTAALYQSALETKKLDARILAMPSAARELNGVEKALPVGADETDTLLCSIRETVSEETRTTAVLTSEKSARDYNLGLSIGEACGAKLPKVPFEFRYAGEGSPILDHPFVSVQRLDLQANELRRGVVDEFFGYLLSSPAQAVFKQQGFRDHDGQPGNVEGVIAKRPNDLPEAQGENLDTEALLAAWEGARKPARMLLMVDVSARMDEPVGDTLESRIRSAKHHISDSLRLIGSRDQVGLWTFARQLDGQRDHRMVVELGDGLSQRTQVDQQLKQLAPTSHGSGIFDAVHAAVLRLRSGPPDNAAAGETSDAVVVVADGRDDALGEFSASDVIELAGADGPGRVRIFVIAFADGVRALPMNSE
jgi:Bacterial extracellular solute-binding protein/von Willebrand factor type A domain